TADVVARGDICRGVFLDLLGGHCGARRRRHLARGHGRRVCHRRLAGRLADQPAEVITIRISARTMETAAARIDAHCTKDMPAFVAFDYCVSQLIARCLLSSSKKTNARWNARHKQRGGYAEEASVLDRQENASGSDREINVAWPRADYSRVPYWLYHDPKVY